MQEEIENRSIAFVISTTKLSLQAVVTGLQTLLRHHARAKAQREMDVQKEALAVPKGKQTVKELVGQGQGVSSIPMERTKLKGFTRVAEKYGVDYAITKDKSVSPPRYLVFFKAKDADALSAAMREVVTKAMGRKRAASVLEDLEQGKAHTVPERSRNMERSL